MHTLIRSIYTTFCSLNLFFTPPRSNSCDFSDNILINQNETDILNSEFRCKVSWQLAEQSVCLVCVEVGWLKQKLTEKEKR